MIIATNENSINIDLSKMTSVKLLNSSIMSIKRKKYKKVCVNVKGKQTYSNICAPIAGIFDFYRKQGISFIVNYESPQCYAKKTNFEKAYEVEQTLNSYVMHNPFDKVWRFNSSEEVDALVNAYILALRQADIVKPGVVSSLEWCLNETMDNVLQHSHADYGYIMGQLHKNNKRFSVCIFDPGIGIYNSLSHSRHVPSTPLDAITLALQEKITRDEKIGQGNGLWGLSQLISDAHGIIRVCSAGASYERDQNGNVSTQKEGDFYLSKDNGTTLIDFQLDYSQEIDVAKALNGHELVDLWLENIEADNGNIIINVASQSHGTGTRKAAEKLRTLVLNITLSDKKKVILDFTGVNLISSSYADELIGKIISQHGFIFFISNFSIINISPTNAFILNRSVQQRMAQNYGH